MLLLTLNNSMNGLMANHLGPYIPVPIPILAEQSAITRLVHVVSTSRYHYVDADTLDDWSETLLQTMRLGTVDLHFARVDAPRMILDRWWVCEWARVEGMRTGGNVSCVDEEKVEDMRACSKVSGPRSVSSLASADFKSLYLVPQCVAARYCSQSASSRYFSLPLSLFSRALTRSHPLAFPLPFLRRAPTTSLEAAQGRVLQIELVDG